MSTHKLKALCPFALDHIEVVITFNFTKGAPAQGATYYHGGLPADPDEIEFVSISPSHHILPPTMRTMLENWARDYLEDDGFEEACTLAHDDIYKGPED
jgi:hypothetical protein